MYKVIRDFRDSRDSGHTYTSGDTYPREGVVVQEERITVLLSDMNDMGEPVIAEVSETVDYSQVSVDELRELLNEKGTEFPKSAKKQELIELLSEV